MLLVVDHSQRPDPLSHLGHVLKAFRIILPKGLAFGDSLLVAAGVSEQLFCPFKFAIVFQEPEFKTDDTDRILEFLVQMFQYFFVCLPGFFIWLALRPRQRTMSYSR